MLLATATFPSKFRIFGIKMLRFSEFLQHFPVEFSQITATPTPSKLRCIVARAFRIVIAISCKKSIFSFTSEWI